METISLERLDKPFDMSVVGGRPDSAVPVADAAMLRYFGEPLGELRAVIGLDCPERERRFFFRSPKESRRGMAGRTHDRLRVRPS